MATGETKLAFGSLLQHHNLAGAVADLKERETELKETRVPVSSSLKKLHFHAASGGSITFALRISMQVGMWRGVSVLGRDISQR